MIIRKRYGLVALALVAVAAMAAFWLVGGPLRSTADSQGDTAILEEGGNINLALREAQKGIGASIVGKPTAIYGKVMSYSAALEAGGSRVVDGDSQAWTFDRPVYLYLFEGHIFDIDPRTHNTSDWEQKIVIFDAETGFPFREIAHRETTKLDVTQFLPLTIRENARGVPPREIEGFDLPEEVPVAPATPAARPAQSR